MKSARLSSFTLHPSSFMLLLSAFCFLFIIALLPLPIPPYLDFQVIYHADLGLLRGISIYDHAGQVNMIAELARVQPEQVQVLPFPYPPWYALAALPLAFLPIQIAARIWFGLNLILLFLSVYLLTDEWTPKKRLFSFLFAFIFIPALGTLLVGQYIFPVLLGASLWIYAVRKQNPALIALASALLTFKPHLGALILLAGLVHLWLRRDAFGRRALIYTAVSGIVLFLIGFFADIAWPVNYIHSLLAFRQNSGVASCELCASLPVAITSFISGESSLAPAPFIGLAIFLIIVIWWGIARREIIKHPVWLMAIAVIITLLASPYLLNYDFVLLLLPLYFLAGQNNNTADWLLVIAAYIIPFISIGFLGRHGNLGFSLSAILLLAILYRRVRQLDGSPDAAYNPATIE